MVVSLCDCRHALVRCVRGALMCRGRECALNVHGYTAGFGNSGCLHKQIRKKGEGCSRLKLHTRNVFAIEEMRVVIKAFDRSVEEQIDLVGFCRS